MHCSVIGVIPANISKTKGYSFGTWWLYGFLLFIVALPHSLLLRPNQAGIEAEQTNNGMRRCPHCADFIQVQARMCRYCGLTPEMLQKQG